MSVTLVTVVSNPVPDVSGPVRDGLLTGRRGRRSARVTQIAVRYLIPVLLAAFVLNLVLTQRSNLNRTLRAVAGAHWVWLPALAAASATTYAMAAVALTAASRQRLVFRRTLAVQVASAFTNRLLPGGVGGLATNVRYLENSGIERPDAFSAVSITWAAGVVAHAGVVVSVVLLYFCHVGAAYRINAPSLDYWPILGGALAVLLVAGLIVRTFLGERAAAFVARLRDNFADLRNRRGDLCALLTGSAAMTCAHTLALVVSIQAFGGGVSLVSIAVVYLAATGLAAAVPVPGGVGPVETALVAGLVGVGAASGAAIAAVLTYRLATFWLPILPGAITFRCLRRRQIL